MQNRQMVYDFSEGFGHHVRQSIVLHNPAVQDNDFGTIKTEFRRVQGDCYRRRRLFADDHRAAQEQRNVFVRGRILMPIDHRTDKRDQNVLLVLRRCPSRWFVSVAVHNDVRSESEHVLRGNPIRVPVFRVVHQVPGD